MTEIDNDLEVGTQVVLEDTDVPDRFALGSENRSLGQPRMKISRTRDFECLARQRRYLKLLSYDGRSIFCDT